MTSEWRHVFPILGWNKGLRETLSRKQFKRQKQLVFNRRLWRNVSIKMLSRISEILKKMEILQTNKQKNIIFKKRGIFSEFSKRNISEKPCQVHKYTQFQVDIFKNDWVLVFWRSKSPLFTLFPAISVSSWSSEFVRFGPFKNCSRAIFRFLDEKLAQKHVSCLQNPKFSVWHYLDLVTLNDLDLEYAHRKLRMIKLSQTRSMLLYWLISISYGSSVRQNQILQIVKHFDIDLTCDIISDPEVNNTRFPSTNVPDLSSAFWIL